MDGNYVTALVGLAGAALGGVTSFATTWLTHRSSLREHHLETERRKLEALFGDFIVEASRLYADALTREQREIAHLVKLYALLGRIRLIASPSVVRAAEHTMTKILETYRQPNRTLADIQELALAGNLNFLLDFGEACRAELDPRGFISLR